MDTNTKLSYQQIMIGRAMTGLIGLREALERLAQEGIAPDDPKVGSRLLAEIRKHNYVPRPAIAEYEQALIREYRRYLQAREKGTQEHLWRDPRKEHHPWFPTIFEEKCDGCGACLGVCPNDVLGWNPEHTKVLVLEPYECAPGCQLCAKVCPRKAIVMPPKEALHQRVDSFGGTATFPDPCAGCSLGSCEGCDKIRSK
ncbi:MAG: ferredoxin family protein [Anaerolineae bacterium]|nr:ferredoxin family protein [Anaerolineae bacterium]